jgi:hypothetical protein
MLKMDTINKTAWAAGFIDADGTITIKRCRRGAEGKWNFLPYISVGQVESNQSIKVLKLLKSMFGGNICRWESKQKWKMKDGRESVYPMNPTVSWQVTSKAAVECIEKIEPHLVLKRANAILLKDFNSKFFRGTAYRAHWLTDEDRAKREAYFFRMRALNNKGKLEAPSTTERGDGQAADATV